MVHLLPSLFTIGVVLLLLLSMGSIIGQILWLAIIPVALLLFYCLLILTDSSILNRSIRVGFLSIAAAFVQLIGYGSGFLRAVWNCLILKRTDFQAFRKTFYK